MVSIYSNLIGWFDSKLRKNLSVSTALGEEYYRTRQSVSDISNVQYDMEMIDNKCSALLTHISIMFVVLVYLITQPGNYFIIKISLLFEIIAYLISALILLRCINIVGPPENMPPKDDAARSYLVSEAMYRRSVYLFALKIVWSLTALLIPIVAVEFLF